MKSRGVFASVLALGVLIASACAGPGPVTAPGQPTPQGKVIVKIGYAAPFSGPAAFTGQDGQRGIEVAIETLNATDTKFTYQFVIADDQNTPAGATAAVRQLLDVEKVDVVLGPNSSGPALAAMPIVNEAKVPQLLYAATSPAIGQQTGKGGAQFTWRLNIDDTIIAATWAKYIADQGVKRIATIAQNDDFGRTASGLYKTEFAKLGVQVVAEEYAAVGASDIRPQVTKIAAGQPDAILGFIQARDAVLLLRSMNEIGLNARLYCRNACISQDFITAATAAGTPNLGNGLQEATVYSLGADTAYDTAFRTKFGQGPTLLFGTLTYNAVLTIAKAAQAGGGGREGIQKGFASVNWNSGMGPVKFNDRNQALPDLFIQTIEGSTIKLLRRVPTVSQ